uniref:rRNA-processing protein UTP23 homolog n=1 Tax=Hippocampus comes TaxID=109280 RepID=A0A3Q2XLA5_HIPCM
MKIKRQKIAKKTLSFYKYNFNFREPFQILIDGTFCQVALKNKIQIKEQMPKYLMGEVQLCTTNCALKELESLGKELVGAKIILQRYQVRKCHHLKSPVPASEFAMYNNDFKLTTGLKKIPGVPLLYIILNTIVLDKPSQSSLDQVQAAQLGELVSPAQQQNLHTMKEEQGIIKNADRRGKKRKRKPHNPNPLSCLKKKKKKGPTPPLKKIEPGQKRSRSRHKKHKIQGESHVALP